MGITRRAIMQTAAAIPAIAFPRPGLAAPSAALALPDAWEVNRLLAPSDAGHLLELDTNLIIRGGDPFPAGFECLVMQMGDKPVTVVGRDGAVISVPTGRRPETRTKHSVLYLMLGVVPGRWYVIGDLA